MNNPVIISFEDETTYVHANGNCPETVMAALWYLHKERVLAQNSPYPRERAVAPRLRAREREIYRHYLGIEAP
jgi:hypothetical protein